MEKIGLAMRKKVLQSAHAQSALVESGELNRLNPNSVIQPTEISSKSKIKARDQSLTPSEGSENDDFSDDSEDEITKSIDISKLKD
jgi:hypothetical protein